MSAVRRRLAERARGAVREVRRQTSTRAAEIARRRGIEILGSKISGLSLLQQRFDVVCAVDVIEHAPDPAEFARELLRPLNPGRPAAVDRRDRHGGVAGGRRRLLVLQHRRAHQLHLAQMGPATCARAATDAVRGRPLPVRGSRPDGTRGGAPPVWRGAGEGASQTFAGADPGNRYRDWKHAHSVGGIGAFADHIVLGFVRSDPGAEPATTA